jgi:hypothetical protein
MLLSSGSVAHTTDTTSDCVQRIAVEGRHPSEMVKKAQ